MTTATTALTLDADAIGRISDRLAEPDWLRELRAAWWERAAATPPPTGSEEEWRRTDLAGLPRDGELLLDPPRLEVSGDLPDGVILTDLRSAVRDHADLLRGHLDPDDGQESHAYFWALAQSAWTGGAGWSRQKPASTRPRSPTSPICSTSRTGCASFGPPGGSAPAPRRLRPGRRRSGDGPTSQHFRVTADC